MSEKAKSILKTVLQDKGSESPSGITSKASKVVNDAKANLRAKKAATAEGEIITPGAKISNDQLVKMARELDKMFSPANFRGVVRAPADLMLAISGRKIWDLPKDEVETLATTGATAARYFMSTDPKWLALTLFSMSVLTTYGTRAMLHAKEKREERKQKPTEEKKT